MDKKDAAELLRPWKDVSLSEAKRDEIWRKILRSSSKPRRRINAVNYIAVAAGLVIAVSVGGVLVNNHSKSTTATMSASYPTTPEGVVKSWIQAQEKGNLLQATTYVYDEFYPTQQLELQHYEQWKDQKPTSFSILNVQYTDSTHAVVNTSLTINSVDKQTYHFDLQKMNGKWKVAFLKLKSSPSSGNSVTATPGLDDPTASPPVTQIMPRN